MELKFVAWTFSGSGWDQCQVIVNKLIDFQIGRFNLLKPTGYVMH